MEGKTINGFTLQRLLGVGGMAEVWYAENKIGKKAAVKILLPKLCQDETVTSRFLNEVKVMVDLNHPNIRQVYDFGEIDGRPTMVMEYLDGDDLRTRLKRGQRFTEEELERWWNQLVDALNYTHQKGIVHRDLKPGNIFVNSEGNIKLLDFGIAKVRESISSTQTGQKLGTLMYMSPEQVKDSKHIDYHTDLYSLAVTFVHLLTGKRPYDSDTSSDFEISEQIVYKPLDMSGVPAGWQSFLTPYLNKEPNQRPALRYFEPVDSNEVHTKAVADEDEGTMVETAEKPMPKSSPKPQPKQAEPQHVAKSQPKPKEPIAETSESSDKPKSKTGLWIVLGIVAAVVALVLFLLKPDDSSKDSSPDYSSYSTSSSNDSYSDNSSYSNSSNYDNSTSDASPSLSNLTITANGVSFMMNIVEGGTYYDEALGRSVTLSNYYMGETEVTQALWNAVMVGNPSRWIGDNLPVDNVDWEDCQSFVRKLNQVTGRRFRLPTESEWEYAAKGGKKSRGYKYAGSDNLSSVAWYKDNSGGKTHAVKGKSPNELGLYDMIGNLWEWCSNGYGNSNPVRRGGSWDSVLNLCQITYRNDSRARKEDFYGFRLCLDY